MIKRHPDTQWLTEYSAGSLPPSQALCVTTHLEFCPDCRLRCAEMLRLGASLFSAEPAGVAEHRTLDEIWQKIQSPMPFSISTRQSRVIDRPTSFHVNYPSDFPNIIRKLIPHGTDNLHWTRLGSRLSIVTLTAADDPQREIALHKLSPGGSVANHDHHGREITVVLSGSFSDQHGQYQPGDFLVREPGDLHRPTASENRECICLSVSDAPVKFTGLLTRLLNPLIAYHHKR